MSRSRRPTRPGVHPIDVAYGHVGIPPVISPVSELYLGNYVVILPEQRIVGAASAAVVGGKLLAIIGAAHKPFLDTYLGRMMDVEIVSADAVLGERTTR